MNEIGIVIKKDNQEILFRGFITEEEMNEKVEEFRKYNTLILEKYKKPTDRSLISKKSD